ncbi:hypothetical protein LTR53_004702 [Teratosphaeriaceae sp. CCFEE 6253]|nr:hypothetical protein LTR53_004702 [Teratosphaeriaceae sp. CCFEE 6253]
MLLSCASSLMRSQDTVDIADLVDQARHARGGSQQHGVIPHIDQLPIFGITRDALLALRYRLADGVTRRLQLRMENADHCPRHGVPNAATKHVKSSYRDTGDWPSPERLLTASSNSPYFDANKSAAQYSSSQTTSRDLGTLPRLPTATSDRPPSVAATSYQQADVQSPKMPPPLVLTRDVIAAPREVDPTRPSTSQLYRSNTSPSQPSIYEEQMVPCRPSDTTRERPSSTSHDATLATSREAVETEATPPPRSSSRIPVSILPASLSDGWSSSTPELRALTSLPSDPADGRPHTARLSATTSIVIPPAPEDPNHDLPPRRELPFQRPSTAMSGSAHGGSRPGTSSMTLPPLPRPKLRTEGSGSSVRGDSLSPEKHAIGSRPGTASPLKRSANDREADVHRPQTSVDSSSIMRDVSPTKKPRTTAAPVLLPTPPARNPSRMEELLATRPPLADRSTNATSYVPRVSSMMDAPHEIISPPPSPGKTGSDTSAMRVLTCEPGTIAVGEYATQSRQERHAAMEEFMMAMLEDPAFATLCEDVENCWQRVALGL